MERTSNVSCPNVLLLLLLVILVRLVVVGAKGLPIDLFFVKLYVHYTSQQKADWLDGWLAGGRVAKAAAQQL